MRLARARISICLLAAMWPACARAQQAQIIADKEVKVVDFQDIKYPPVARHARIQGVVVVRVKLDDHGNVEDAGALSGSETLIPDTLANAKTWRFQPNAKKSAIIVYNFRIPNGGCKSGETLSIFEAPNFVTVRTCAVSVDQ